jgi:hypothetical protein
MSYRNSIHRVPHTDWPGLEPGSLDSQYAEENICLQGVQFLTGMFLPKLINIKLSQNFLDKHMLDTRTIYGAESERSGSGIWSRNLKEIMDRNLFE